MATIISSQRFRSEEIIQAKQDAQDYVVTLSPVFIHNDEEYQVVLNGHHAYEAALRNGAEPTYREATLQDTDTIALLTEGKTEDFLITTWIDSNYYDLITEYEIW